MGTTTNLGIEVPDVGADNNTWGTILVTQTFAGLDAIFKSDGAGTSVGLNVGSGKTLALAGTGTVTGTLGCSGGTLVLPAATTPAQTAEGSVVWDSDSDLLTIGTGAARKTMVDTDSSQTLTNKTLTTPVFSGVPTGTVTAATFTPTIGGTASTNVGSSSLQAAWYQRVGNVVSGGVTFFLTASSAAAVTVSISLPVASNFSTIYQAAGSVWAEGSATLVHGRLVGSSANDDLVVRYTPGDTTLHEVSVLFSYVVI